MPVDEDDALTGFMAHLSEELNEVFGRLEAAKTSERRTKMAQPRIVILDLETSGLDPQKNVIFELGIQLYTAQLDLIDEREWICSDANTLGHLDHLLSADGDKYVATMHNNSGLVSDMRNEATVVAYNQLDVQSKAITWLAEYNLGNNHVKLPLTGSTIDFDRKFMAAQMPELDAAFHYRSINISSIKEAAQLYCPNLVERRDKELSPRKAHRSLLDCVDTRDEFAFYVENLFLDSE